MTLLLAVTGSAELTEIAEPIIVSPQDGAVYRLGDTIPFEVRVPDMNDWVEFYVDGEEQLLFPEADYWGWVFDSNDFGDGEHIFEVVYYGDGEPIRITSSFTAVTNPQVRRAVFENGMIMLTFTSELNESTLANRMELSIGGKAMNFTYSYENCTVCITPDMYIDDTVYMVSFRDGIESESGEAVVQKSAAVRSGNGTIAEPSFVKKSSRVSVLPEMLSPCRIYLASYDGGILKELTEYDGSSAMNVSLYDTAAVFCTDDKGAPTGDVWLDGDGIISADYDLSDISYKEETDITYDKESGIIVISGKSGAYEKIMASVMSEDGTPAAFTQTTADKNGNFAVAVKLDASYLSGYYNVETVSASKNSGCRLLYSNAAEAAELIPKFNQADDVTKMKQMFDNNYLRSVIDYESLLLCDDSVYDLLVHESLKNYTDISEIKQLISKAICVNRVSAGQDSLKYIVQSAADFGFDESLLNNLSEKTLLEEIMEENTYGTFEEYAAAYNNALMLARLSQASNADSLKNLVTEVYKEILNIPQSTKVAEKYEAVKEKSRVYEKLLGKYKSQDKFLKAFETAVKNVYDEQNKKSNTTTGSGGGSGSTVKVAADYIPPTTEEKSKLFTDLEGYEWAVEAITGLAQRNIVSGYGDGSFMPAKLLSREEFVRLLVDAFEVNAADAYADFADVPEQRWSYPYVAKAYTAGITAGIGGGMFGALDTVTREDMISLLYRMAAGRKKPDTDYEAPAYSDYYNISEYAREAVAFMKGEQLGIKVQSSQFSPQEGVSRAEAAVTIWQTLNYLQEDN